jgi:fatty-acyl-CoA synthase
MGAWQPMTISQALDRATSKYATRPFVMTDGRIWSYQDVQEASRQVAARLIEQGVRPRDHVGLILGNYVEFVIAKFAIARIGAVAVPINIVLRQRELSYIIAQADCVALITMDWYRGRDYLADLDAIMPGWELAGGGENFPKLHTVFVVHTDGSERPGVKQLTEPDWTPRIQTWETLKNAEHGADPYFACDVIYTSGTTGHPKGAIVTHDMVLRTGYASTYAMAREEGRRVLFAVPLYHVFGYVECLIASMFVGGAIIPRAAFDAKDMVEAAERFEVGEIACVPSMTRQMIEVAKERGFHCPSLVAFFNSGGDYPPTIWQEIRDVFGASELLMGYGMTETTASTCCCLPEGEDIHLLTSHGRLKDAGAAGFAEYGGKLAIYKAVNPETGEDLPHGEKGELLVRGYCVTRGYYNKPDENARAFTEDGWLRTGDVGTVDAEGYIRLLGRIKESYRCGGEMVMPEEVENFLKTHESIQNVYVVGVPDPKMGEVGCALIVPRGDVPDANAIMDFCRDRIARFKIPKYVIEVAPDKVPHTATGRPRRVFLASLARERLGL